MKSFDELYNDLVITYSDEYEISFITKYLKQIIIIILFIVFIVLTIILYYKAGFDESAKLFLSISASIVCTAFILLIIYPLLRMAGIALDNGMKKEEYKDKIVRPFFENVFPNCMLFLQNGFSKENYDEIGFNFKYNMFLSDYYMQVQLPLEENRKLDLKMSEICLIDADLNNISKGYKSIRFILSECLLSKNCNLKINIKSRKSRISFDKEGLNNYFLVESDDNDDVLKSILTPEVINQMINFYKSISNDFEIIIRNDKIYIRIFDKILFKYKGCMSVFDKNVLEESNNILQFIKDINIAIAKNI